MMASAEGEVEVVGLLLEAGADKNLADADGSTALTQASDNGHVEVVRLLRNRGSKATRLAAGPPVLVDGPYIFKEMTLIQTVSFNGKASLKHGTLKVPLASPT